MYATEDLVRVHPDGGITTIARSGNSSQQWYKLEGGRKVEVSAPKKPAARYKDDFVQMGKVSLAPKVEAELSRLRIDKAEFSKDYPSIKNAVDANPALVEGWKVLHEAGETGLKTDVKELKIVTENLADIQKAGNFENWMSTFLKNNDFKEVYNGLKSGSTPRKFSDELSLLEESAFKFYTNATYYKFNQALINNSTAKDILAIEKLFNRTLSKLKPYPGKYYRGIGKTEINMFRKLKVGDEIKYDNFLSTTSELDLAWKFYRNNERKTGEAALVYIESKSGRSLDKYSDAVEWEVLHKSKTRFKFEKMEIEKGYIVNIEDVALLGLPAEKIDLTRIYIKEIK